MVSALAPRSRCDRQTDRQTDNVHYMEYRPYSITIIGMHTFFKDSTELKDFAHIISITFQLLFAHSCLNCGKCASS